MKFTKKILSFMLALTMLFCMMAGIDLSAFAQIDEYDCGNNLKWSLSEDGTLTITGTGDMIDFYDAYTYSGPPWSMCLENIYEVVINSGVTSIGNHAFADCKNLKNIIIPNSVTSIGCNAFSFCQSLTNLSIPNSVTDIGDEAFHNCSSLTSLTIPNGVTNLGYRLFRFCSSLKSVTISSSVTHLGDVAFLDCDSLTEINVDSNNKNYSSANGVLYNKNKTELIRYPSGKKDSSFVIPNSVKYIYDYAFQKSSSLTSVTIPNSVTDIDYWAFEYCSNLTSVTIPSGVTSILDGTFYNCTNLTNVTIPNSVTSIGYYAFGKCTSLKSITIPNSVTYIDNWVFEYCSSLENITVLNKKCEIGYGSIPSDTTIYGYSNSTAADYAKNNGNKFIAIDSLSSKALSAPQNLMVSNLAANGGKLSWNSVPGASGYQLQYVSNGAWKNFGDVTTNSRTFSGFANNTCYTFRVRAYAAANGQKVYSNNWSAPISFTTYSTVSRISFSNINTKGATLNINNVANASGYALQYVSNGAWKDLGDTTAKSRVFNSLASGTSYTFRVRTYTVVSGQKVYASNWSAPYSFKTLVDGTKLSAPTKLATSNLSTTGAALTWNAVSGANGYQLQYVSNGAWKNFGDVTTNSRTFSGLASATSYTFRVRAYAVVNGQKIYSNNWSSAVTFKTLVDGTKLSSPTNLAVSGLSATGAQLAWNAVSGASGYQLQYVSNGAWKNFGDVTTNSRTFSGLASNTCYTFRVRAYAAVNGQKVYSNNWSAPISFTTYSTVSRISFSNINTKGATLNINSVANASGYALQYVSNGVWKDLGDTTAKSRVFNSLASGTSYTFRVRTYTVVNGQKVYSSNWSAPYSFTTLAK